MNASKDKDTIWETVLFYVFFGAAGGGALGATFTFWYLVPTKTGYSNATAFSDYVKNDTPEAMKIRFTVGFVLGFIATVIFIYYLLKKRKQKLTGYKKTKMNYQDRDRNSPYYDN